MRRWKRAIGIALLVVLVVTAITVPIVVIAQPPATPMVTITISLTPVGCNPPTDLTATQIDDYTIRLTWTAAENTTMVRRELGAYPANSTSGTLIYEGNASAANDTFVISITDFLDLTEESIYYRAWSVCNGNTSALYDDAEIEGGVAMGYIALGILALGLTGITWKTRHYLWALPAAVFWFVLWSYTANNPISGTVQGDSTQTMMMLAFLAAGIACIMWALYRRFVSQRGMADEFSVTSEQDVMLDPLNKNSARDYMARMSGNSKGPSTSRERGLVHKARMRGALEGDESKKRRKR